MKYVKMEVIAGAMMAVMAASSVSLAGGGGEELKKLTTSALKTSAEKSQSRYLDWSEKLFQGFDENQLKDFLNTEQTVLEQFKQYSPDSSKVSKATQVGKDKAGNGGGAWVCQNTDQLSTIRWARMVDLYEAENEFGLTIQGFGARSSEEILDVIRLRLFDLNKSLYQEINDQLKSVQANTNLVSSDLRVIDDSLYRIQPGRSECLGGTAQYVQLANYTDYGKILVQRGLYESPSLSGTDKAALLIHEAVYAYLRESSQDKDSVRTRKVVGLLFSTLPQDLLKKEIEKTLGGGLNAIGMDFVRIRAGSFMMGSPDNEAGRYYNEKQHLVQLTQDYEIQTTEVTQKQYFDVMGINPSDFNNIQNCPKTYQASASGFIGCPNNPVEQVNYNDVQAFIAKLNSQRKDGYFYRLPTEAEFEFAARAGTSTAYSFGNDPSQLALYGWFSGNAGGQTHEVAQLKPNALGLYDMHGNVWEWVSDFYPDKYDNSGSINPVGPSSGSYRVVRGGSWYSSAQYLRSALRYYGYPDNRLPNLGVRLVRTK